MPTTTESTRLRAKYNRAKHKARQRYDMGAEVNGAVYEMWEARLAKAEGEMGAVAKERDHWKAMYEALLTKTNREIGSLKASRDRYKRDYKKLLGRKG